MKTIRIIKLPSFSNRITSDYGLHIDSAPKDNYNYVRPENIRQFESGTTSYRTTIFVEPPIYSLNFAERKGNIKNKDYALVFNGYFCFNSPKTTLRILKIKVHNVLKFIK